MRVCTHGCVVAGARTCTCSLWSELPEIIHRLIMHLWPHTVYHVSVLVQQSISTTQNMRGLLACRNSKFLIYTRDNNMKDGF